jgi:PAS domain S-box-containing protein
MNIHAESQSHYEKTTPTQNLERVLWVVLLIIAALYVPWEYWADNFFMAENPILRHGGAFFVFAGGIGAWLSWKTATRAPQKRWAWLWMGLGFLLEVVGHLSASILSLGEDMAHAYFKVGHLGLSLCFAVGLYCYPKRTLTPSEHLQMLLDAAVITLSWGSLLWYGYLSNTFASAGTLLEKTLVWVLPLSYLLLLSMFFLVSLRRATRNYPLELLYLGLGFALSLPYSAFERALAQSNTLHHWVEISDLWRLVIFALAAYQASHAFRSKSMSNRHLNKTHNKTHLSEESLLNPVQLEGSAESDSVQFNTQINAQSHLQNNLQNNLQLGDTENIFGDPDSSDTEEFIAEDHPSSQWLRGVLLALPYSAVLLSQATILVAYSNGKVPLGLLLLGVVVILLVLLRQGLTFNENQRLSSSLSLSSANEEALRSSLKEREAHYQTLVEHSSDLVQIISLQGNIHYASPSHQEKLNYTPEEMQNERLSKFLHPEDYNKLLAHLQRSRHKTQVSTPLLYRSRHREGGWRWLEGVTRDLSQDPSIRGIVINARDVTEREEALERVEQLNGQLESRLERITALHNIDLAISARLSLKSTLELVLAQANQHLGVEAGAIRLKQRDGRYTDFYTGLGFKNDEARDALLMLGSRWADNVMLEGKALGTRLVTDINSKWNPVFGGIRYFAAPIMVEGKARGVLEVYQKGDTRRDREWHNFLETLAGQAALAVENDSLLGDLKRSNRELLQAYNEVIEGWAKALDLRDKETEGHSRRVTDLSVRLAQRMGIQGEALIHLRRGALLHDIGKTGIPDSILLKPGPLTEEEWVVMRRHPQLSYNFLYPLEFLRPALDIPYCHHEKWDGTGYPRGLSKENIPLPARIFAIVDVWDALTSDRPYHKKRTPQEAAEIVRAGTGKHFDPVVVKAFFELEEIILKENA